MSCLLLGWLLLFSFFVVVEENNVMTIEKFVEKLKERNNIITLCTVKKIECENDDCVLVCLIVFPFYVTHGK